MCLSGVKYILLHREIFSNYTAHDEIARDAMEEWIIGTLIRIERNETCLNYLLNVRIGL